MSTLAPSAANFSHTKAPRPLEVIAATISQRETPAVGQGAFLTWSRLSPARFFPLASRACLSGGFCRYSLQ